MDALLAEYFHKLMAVIRAYQELEAQNERLEQAAPYLKAENQALRLQLQQLQTQLGQASLVSSQAQGQTQQLASALALTQTLRD